MHRQWAKTLQAVQRTDKEQGADDLSKNAKRKTLTTLTKAIPSVNLLF